MQRHVLYAQDDDVAFVRVGQTKFELGVASPIDSVSLIGRENGEKMTNLSEMVIGELLVSVQSHDSVFLLAGAEFELMVGTGRMYLA